MRILLTGGTGLIGRALCRRWAAEGHDLIVLSRRPGEVASLCSGARGIESLSQVNRHTPVDAVVNLAGAPIADRPWTDARRNLLWQSRIELTGALLDWLEGLQRRPTVLISGSAVGVYGDRGDEVLDEDSRLDDTDFGARMCAAWEDTARRAERLDIRVALVRTAPVLSAEGGILSRMKAPFRMGLGGRLGSGRQWMPWIHIDDEVGLIDFLLHGQDCAGAYNACAPEAVRNADFARALGRAVQRRAVLPVPAPVLRLALGEMAVLLLGSQHLRPARALAAGYQFQYARLDDALADTVK
jgi:uncharacterized protein (TIGR01777 family)